MTSLVKDLNSKWAPSTESSTQRKRLVIVGDVHGRLPQLMKLLEKIGFDNKSGDHLVFTGDLINKGPDSPGVVQLAMDLGASAVRETTKIACWRRMHSLRAVVFPTTSGSDGRLVFEDSNVPLPEDIPYAVSSDYVTATQLSEEQVAWLSSLPLILRIGTLQGATTAPWNAGSIVVAHAGLVPSVPLEQQDPWAVMNMHGLVHPTEDTHHETIQVALTKAARDRFWRRASFEATADDAGLSQSPGSQDQEETWRSPDGIAPIEASEGKLWRDAWNESQNLIEVPGQRTVVVYGHDARAGLQVRREMDSSEDLGEEGVNGVWSSVEQVKET
ncbi:hypothetical protein BG005_002226 [Podila minutissima]|nr:hypothetical protein BG005_002226 [Podila minutissima]